MSLNTYIVDLQLFWGEMINLEFQIINFFFVIAAYLHHEQNGIEDDESHDEILEWR